MIKLKLEDVHSLENLTLEDLRCLQNAIRYYFRKNKYARYSCLKKLANLFDNIDSKICNHIFGAL